MQLSIESLVGIGAFTGAPVSREIVWKIGEQEYKADVFVRPLSYHSAVADLKSMAENRDAIAARIAVSIVDEHGKPVFQAADITGDADPDRGPMDGNLVWALLAAIADVNGLGKQPVPT